MANKTIYIRDEGIWERAKLVAEREGISLSEIIARAIEAYVTKDGCPRCMVIKRLLGD